MRIFAIVYALVVGCGMLAQWIMFIASGQVPELATEPARIAMHLSAEAACALSLIVAAIAWLRKRTWAPRLMLFACGMLVYTLIQSPGYFLHLGQYGFVAMFAVLMLPALIISGWLLRGKQSPAS